VIRTSRNISFNNIDIEEIIEIKRIFKKIPWDRQEKSLLRNTVFKIGQEDLFCQEKILTWLTQQSVIGSRDKKTSKVT